jgi:hypothetical protein
MKKLKDWKEGEVILTFKLTKIFHEQQPQPEMREWIDIAPPKLTIGEQELFEITFRNASEKIMGWSEEDLKMKLISPVLGLGHILEGNTFTSFFDKDMKEEVEGYKLALKADFVVAQGKLDFMQKPYFHFQEYKPHKNPSGDPMAQLLAAFLIGQKRNQNNKPIYGCEIIGKLWTFVLIVGKTYTVSKSFDCTQRADLLQIIAILRKFKEILETKLLD